MFPSSGSVSVLTSTVTNTTVGAAVSFQCEEGFLSSGLNTTTITCNESGLWIPNPAVLVCRVSGVYIEILTPYSASLILALMPN